MKGLPLVLLLAVAAVIFGLGIFLLLKQEKKEPAATVTQNTPANTVNAVEPKMMEKTLTDLGSVRCEYTDETGASVIAYVKEGNIRTEYEGNTQDTSVSIYNDNTVWSWNPETKEGYTIHFVTGETPEERKVREDSMYDRAAVEKQIQQYKDSCRETQVEDSMFSPPNEVTFRSLNTAIPEDLPQDTDAAQEEIILPQ